MSDKRTKPSRTPAERAAAIREDVTKLEGRASRVRLHEERRATWLEVRRVTNLGTEFVFEVRFPRGYPWVGPNARLLAPLAAGRAPHQYSDGRLCIQVAWGPNDRDLVAYVAALDAYAALFERFQLTGASWGGEPDASAAPSTVLDEDYIPF
jgi:hypothetical protein